MHKAGKPPSETAICISRHSVTLFLSESRVEEVTNSKLNSPHELKVTNRFGYLALSRSSIQEHTVHSSRRKVGNQYTPGRENRWTSLHNSGPNSPLHAYVRPDTHQYTTIFNLLLLENVNSFLGLQRYEVLGPT